MYNLLFYFAYFSNEDLCFVNPFLLLEFQLTVTSRMSYCIHINCKHFTKLYLTECIFQELDVFYVLAELHTS